MFLTNILNPIANVRAMTLGAIVVVLSACSQTSSAPDVSVDYSGSVAKDGSVPEVVITASRTTAAFEG